MPIYYPQVTLTDGAAQISSGTVSFDDANGISFGFNGQTITGSHNALTSQSNQAFSAAGGSSAFQTLSVSDNAYASFTNNAGQLAITELRGSFFAVSNTTQSTSGTQNLDALSFAGAGGASVGVSNGSILISVGAGGAGDGVNIIAAGTQTANTTGTVVFSNSNNMTFGMSDSSVVTASFNAINVGVSTGGNTAGTTGTIEGAGGQYLFVGSHGITLSQSTNGANSGTVTIRGVPAQSSYENYPLTTFGTFNWAGNSTSYIAPFALPFDIAAGWVRVPCVMGTNSSSIASTANTTFSCSIQSTIRYMVYKQMTGASSLSLESVTSGSVPFDQQWSFQANANGSQWTMTNNITYPITGATAQYTTSVAASNASFQFSSNSLTAFTANRFLDIPMNTTLSAGQYWMMIGVSSTTSTQAAAVAGFTNLRVVASCLIATANNSAIQVFGSAPSASLHLRPAQGSFSTAGGATTNQFAMSAVSSQATHPIVMFQLRSYGP